MTRRENKTENRYYKCKPITCSTRKNTIFGTLPLEKLNEYI